MPHPGWFSPFAIWPPGYPLDHTILLITLSSWSHYPLDHTILLITLSSWSHYPLDHLFTQHLVTFLCKRIHHRRMVRWCIRLTRLTLVCKVIRYCLVQVRQNHKKKRLFGLAARNRLSLFLPLSFSSSSYFLSFSIQTFFVQVAHLCLLPSSLILYSHHTFVLHLVV